MPDILSNAVFLYSIPKSGLIATFMRPLFPVIFLKKISCSNFAYIFQSVRGFFEKNKFGNQFPLITVMGPRGPITHCYVSTRNQY